MSIGEAHNAVLREYDFGHSGSYSRDRFRRAVWRWYESLETKPSGLDVALRKALGQDQLERYERWSSWWRHVTARGYPGPDVVRDGLIRDGNVDPQTASEVARFLEVAWNHGDVVAKALPRGSSPAARIFFDVMAASRDHWTTVGRAKLTDKEEDIGTIASDAIGGLVGLLGGPAAAIVASALTSITWVESRPEGGETASGDCSQCHTNPH